jgi:hypothetical protein
MNALKPGDIICRNRECLEKYEIDTDSNGNDLAEFTVVDSGEYGDFPDFPDCDLVVVISSCDNPYALGTVLAARAEEAELLRTAEEEEEASSYLLAETEIGL